jgi:hypothetical protein
MPTSSEENSSAAPFGSEGRANRILISESFFVGLGFLTVVFAFVELLRYLGDTHLRWLGPYWFGGTGCLLYIASVLVFTVIASAGMALGWWLWLLVLAKRLAVTNMELYLICTRPFRMPLLSRLFLRIAGISKAEEKELRQALRERRRN